jgi:hypothetical protein
MLNARRQSLIVVAACFGLGAGCFHEDVGLERTDETGGDEGNEPDPTCMDGKQNQGETDVDCGGPNCDACADPVCDDGVNNGDETDVDCGGSCDPCDDNLGCKGGSDCASGVCTDDVCIPPNCGDGVQNGTETDVDCGGECMGCGENGSCKNDGDCLSMSCEDQNCAPAACMTDGDCTAFDSDCTQGVCGGDFTCNAMSINEQGACDDMDLCTTGEKCGGGACVAGVPTDCSDMSDDCNVGVCNENDGQCTTEAVNDDNPCDDASQCTQNEVCGGGDCEDPGGVGYLFHEDFEDNVQGWTLGPDWEIGPAQASNCGLQCPGNDPAEDHTDTDDNGIAGVLIGGCPSNAQHDDYCIESPTIDTSGEQGDVWLTFWRHLHSDYPPYFTPSVQVSDGNGWQEVYASACCDCANDNQWTEQAYEVTAYKGPNFRVRFCYKSENAGSYTGGGWNIDDVTVAPTQCTP